MRSIPEAVAVAQPLELVGEDRADQRAGAAAGDVVLGQGADPEVDVVDAAVKRLRAWPARPVGRDLREARHPRQAVGGPDGVVVGQAVVAAALDVEAARSRPPAPGGPKRKLRTLSTTLVSTSEDGSEARYLRIGSMPSAGRSAGLKNASLSGDLVGDRQAVVVEELDVVAEQAVAEAEGGGRELVGDARVDVGL